MRLHFIFESKPTPRDQNTKHIVIPAMENHAKFPK